MLEISSYINNSGVIPAGFVFPEYMSEEQKQRILDSVNATAKKIENILVQNNGIEPEEYTLPELYHFVSVVFGSMTHNNEPIDQFYYSQDISKVQIAPNSKIHVVRNPDL
jgi:ketopantoate reductase